MAISHALSTGRIVLLCVLWCLVTGCEENVPDSRLPLHLSERGREAASAVIKETDLFAEHIIARYQCPSASRGLAKEGPIISESDYLALVSDQPGLFQLQDFALTTDPKVPMPAHLSEALDALTSGTSLAPSQSSQSLHFIPYWVLLSWQNQHQDETSEELALRAYTVLNHYFAIVEENPEQATNVLRGTLRVLDVLLHALYHADCMENQKQGRDEFLAEVDRFYELIRSELEPAGGQVSMTRLERERALGAIE